MCSSSRLVLHVALLEAARPRFSWLFTRSTPTPPPLPFSISARFALLSHNCTRRLKHLPVRIILFLFALVSFLVSVSTFFRVQLATVARRVFLSQTRIDQHRLTLIISTVNMPKEKTTRKAKAPVQRRKKGMFFFWFDGAATDGLTTNLDPNAPKRGLSAYMFFANEQRDRVREENPGITFGMRSFPLRPFL